MWKVVGVMATAFGVIELVARVAIYLPLLRRALRDHSHPGAIRRPLRVHLKDVYPRRRITAGAPDDAHRPAGTQRGSADSPALPGTGEEEEARLVDQLLTGEIDPSVYRRLMGELAASATRGGLPGLPI